MEGKPNLCSRIYDQGMRSFEQYDKASKYFTEGKLANEVQAQLQLYDVSLGEYLVNKYALWLDFRTIDENELHGTGRKKKMHWKVLPYKLRKKKNQLGLLMLTFT